MSICSGRIFAALMDRSRHRDAVAPAILNTVNDCANTPVPGIDVYIWHTDAQGYYSGFGDPGEQTPDIRYAGKPGRNDLDNSMQFCRGAGVTDARGVLPQHFPGW